MALYRWANAVALAVLDDIGILEVAMRSAMARELEATHGIDWFRRRDLLDDPTLKMIETAWKSARLQTLHATPDVIHGKLVATLMFGFWVKILGRGEYQGQPPARDRRIYDTLLWRAALHRAFPNVSVTQRHLVEKAAHRVRAARNRVAHHEHIIWGVPMPGEATANGIPVRLTVTEAHTTLLVLADYVDTDLGAWLRQHSQVPALLAACPVTDTTRLAL